MHIVIGGAHGGPTFNHWDKYQNLLRHQFDPLDNFALGLSNGQEQFYITRYDGGCSLLEPDLKTVANWRHPDGSSFLNALQIVEKRLVQVVRLDDWCRDNRVTPDFIMLNVQGSELDVLRGARRVLPRVLGVQLEANFVSYYLKQPTYADIYQFLDAHGFEFFAFLSNCMMGRMSAPGMQQCFEGHCLWLRNPSTVDPALWPRLAQIADIYGQAGFAAQLRGAIP